MINCSMRNLSVENTVEDSNWDQILLMVVWRPKNKKTRLKLGHLDLLSVLSISNSSWQGSYLWCIVTTNSSATNLETSSSTSFGRCDVSLLSVCSASDLRASMVKWICLTLLWSSCFWALRRLFLRLCGPSLWIPGVRWWELSCVGCILCLIPVICRFPRRPLILPH